MTARLRLHVACVVASLLVPASSNAGGAALWLNTVDQMITDMGAESVQDAESIRRLYLPYLKPLLLTGYPDLQVARATGGLVPLPENLKSFNLLPRLAGEHPIGEMDLDNQGSYIAARPATIGALIVVASRVRSVPVEVTSLVRHAEYQEELRGININATTALPMHTMGMAFDIALVNTPLKGVQEIRAVLERMRAAGDILFIGERQQLVFHVVPHPSRLGYFNDIYARAVGAISGNQTVEVVAPGPVPRIDVLHPVPHVVTDIVAMTAVTDHARAVDVAEHADAAAPIVTTPGARRQSAASMVVMMCVWGVLASVVATATGSASRLRSYREENPMAEQQDDPGIDQAQPPPDEDREEERERVRSSNDRDQELERHGVVSEHNRGYDEAVDGGASSESGGIEDVDNASDEE